MPKTTKPGSLSDESVSLSAQLTITMSAQSLAMLNQLASYGIYGRTAGEVAVRIIDRELCRRYEEATGV